MFGLNVGALRAVADRLDVLEVRYAFVGGSIINLLIDYPELTPARPTDDVDVIIEVVPGRYSDMEARLRGIGFNHDMRPGAPTCRWVLGGLSVDIMPTDGAALGLNTAWFAEALATAKTCTFAHSTFQVISPVALLATKYVAFLDRGGGDFYGSHDLEDFMTVIDGRAQIVKEVAAAPVHLRRFVIKAVTDLLSSPALRDALPGYLSPEEESRVVLLRQKLSGIAAL